MMTVIIVNYYTEGLTSACIRSIALAEPRLISKLEFVVVDNGSFLDWQLLLSGLPTVRIITPGENVGFARAANMGIRAASNGYILLINPDTLVSSGALSKGLAFMEDPANLKVAVLGPTVYNDRDGNSIQASARRFPGASTTLFTRTSLLTRLWPENPLVKKFLYSDLPRTGPVRVDWVSGCCMLIRRAALDSIGFLDERFFLFFEDVDLCRRGWNSGWEVALLPEAKIYHQVGASMRRRPFRRVLELHRSAWIYFRKHFRHRAILHSLVFLGICVRGLIEILTTVLSEILYQRK